MVGLQTLNLTMVVRSHPPQPRAPVDQRIDRRFAEPEAVGSIPARRALEGSHSGQLHEFRKLEGEISTQVQILYPPQ